MKEEWKRASAKEKLEAYLRWFMSPAFLLIAAVVILGAIWLGLK